MPDKLTICTIFYVFKLHFYLKRCGIAWHGVVVGIKRYCLVCHIVLWAMPHSTFFYFCCSFSFAFKFLFLWAFYDYQNVINCQLSLIMLLSSYFYALSWKLSWLVSWWWWWWFFFSLSIYFLFWFYYLKGLIYISDTCTKLNVNVLSLPQ